MINYMVKLKIVGECESDVRELIQQYTGEETDVEIISIEAINKVEKITEEEWKQIKKDDMEMDAHEGEM